MFTSSCESQIKWKIPVAFVRTENCTCLANAERESSSITNMQYSQNAGTHSNSYFVRYFSYESLFITFGKDTNKAAERDSLHWITLADEIKYKM